MYAFTYWHAYYDSAYLHYPVKISPYLYKELQINAAPHIKWMEFPLLPQLPKLFELVETFMNNKAMWIPCNCNIIEAITIETNLNQILLRIYCEKLYAKEYWLQDKRRVQASFVHFLIILKHIVVALIPEDCSCLLQVMQQQKLCIQIGCLETLVNQVLSNLKPIFKYMLHKLFREEKQLTKLFFDEIRTFSQRLPEITREQLIQIPKLMHYICLRNPIDTTKEHTHHLEEQIRKKSTTLQQKTKVQSPLRSIEEEDERNSDILDTRQFIKNRENNKSTDRQSTIQSINRGHHKAKNIIFFKFVKSICKEDTLLDKKPTMDSLQTKEKSLSIEKVTRYRSSTIDPHSKHPIKSKSFMESRTKLISVSKNRRERINTSKSKDSKKTIELKRKQADGKEEEEIERKNKPPKKKQFLAPTKPIFYSSQIHLTTGQSKGWGVIREFVFNKIVQRKVMRLLSSF